MYWFLYLRTIVYFIYFDNILQVSHILNVNIRLVSYRSIPVNNVKWLGRLSSNIKKNKQTNKQKTNKKPPQKNRIIIGVVYFVQLVFSYISWCLLLLKCKNYVRFVYTFISFVGVHVLFIFFIVKQNRLIIELLEIDYKLYKCSFT